MNEIEPPPKGPYDSWGLLAWDGLGGILGVAVVFGLFCYMVLGVGR